MGVEEGAIAKSKRFPVQEYKPARMTGQEEYSRSGKNFSFSLCSWHKVSNWANAAGPSKALRSAEMQNSEQEVAGSWGKVCNTLCSARKGKIYPQHFVHGIGVSRGVEMAVFRGVLIFAALHGVFALAGSGAALAQSWPAKPVRMVVSTGPGQATDVAGRLLADRLSRVLGQQVVVENMAGAAGTIGAQAVVRAAPDGYTFLFTGGGTLVTNVFAFKSLPYDPARDFAPVALVTRASGFVISVTPDLPAKTLPELVALAKSQPGKLSYAVDSSNIYVSLIGRMLNKVAGIDITEISYKSPTQAVLDTVAGRTQIIIASVTAVDAAARAGKLRIIAVTSSGRHAAFPELPSMVETFPSLQLDAVGFTVVAPAGTPAAVVQRLNRAIVAVLKDAQFEQQLAAQGQAPARATTPAETAEELHQQRQRWGSIFRDLGIQPR